VVAGTNGRHPGLVIAGQLLVESVRDIMQAWRERLRSNELSSRAARLDDLELEDHAATMVTDIGLSMRTIGAADSDGASAMRDGSEILRVIAERHGAQRNRVGWREEEIDAEVAALRIEAERILAGRMADQSDEVRRATSDAVALLAQLLEQAARVSRRAYRVAAAAAQR
jgi:hypothetical protein